MTTREAAIERQNITLSLPKALLREARHLAVERGVSLSGMLAEFVERMVRDDEAYRAARERARRRLARGYDLGTGGELAIDRDELHER